MTNLKVMGVVFVTLALYTWVANAIPQLESVVPEELSFSADVTEAELVAAGQQLFNGGAGCVTCHGLVTRAPNLVSDHAGQGTIGQRCGTRVPGQDCKDYLHASLTDPMSYVVDGFDPMVFQARVFSGAQIWALVAFLQDQGGPVTVTGADVATAAEADAAAPPAGGPLTASLDPLEIMQANLCLACHVLDGQGIATGPPFDGMGSRIDADRIRRAILDPAAEAAEGYEQMLGLMTPTIADMLSARQLEVLVEFLAGQGG
jgi:cytochrome c553